MKLHRNESGQMLIMTAIEITLLIGFLALAADVGVLFHTKRHMQTAVDAAATAAALNHYNAGLAVGASDETDTYAACMAVVNNGYGQPTDCPAKTADPFLPQTPASYSFTTSDGTQVTISEPPQNGYHKLTIAGNPAYGYVEVIMSKPDPLFFFRVFTGNNTATVAVRAVAGDPVGSAGCLYAQKVVFKGNMTISGPNGTKACGMYIANSLTNQDNGTNINTDFVETPNATYNGFNTSPTPVTALSGGDNPPFPDLYQPTLLDTGINTAPNTSTLCTPPGVDTPDSNGFYGNVDPNSTVNVDGSNNAILPTPGDFTPTGTSSTIHSVYCFTQKVTIGSTNTSIVNMPSGFYVFEKGATITGQVNFGLDGSGCYNNTVGSATIGATLYNGSSDGNPTPGAITEKNGTLAICAPTAGVYNALAIVQPLINTNSLYLQFGNSNLASTDCTITDASLNGWIYAPGANVVLQDQGGGLLVTGIVAYAIGDPNGNPSGFANTDITTCNYNSVNNSTTPLRQIALVE